ncbi:hypothetical protein [Yinghuangia seranimata]|uniref:hypothetical protein n=1 Tax=Yinghuangia seranimata TaxID=408067 RepID=UPI00248CBCFE|nr:hypothetical protein [Yinghuangia seranimata]MDI2128666.1 hypothetical protein [Yinghuangia seranimata]
MSESPSIAQLLDRFLSDQEDRLTLQQYRACSTVVDMLAAYLNRYAFATLNVVDRKEWDEAYEAGDTEAFCNLFGVRKLVIGIKPFHGEHLRGRLRAPEMVQEHALTVTSELADWLASEGLSGGA